MSFEETLSSHPKPFYFPRPPKIETVSHSVSAWYIGKVEALSGPKDKCRDILYILSRSMGDPEFICWKSASH